MVVMLLILIFCVLLFGAGAVMAGFGWLAAVVAMLLALYGLIVAAAWLFVGIRDTAPKLPGAAAAFFCGYAKILCAPVLGPSDEWRSFSERRAGGEHGCGLNGLHAFVDLHCGAILKLDGSRHTDFDREWPVSGVALVTRRIAAVAGRASSNMSAHYEEQMTLSLIHI